MKRIMIAAMGSGSGKTVLTCGLLRALQRRGISAEGFKCGPDYIDPMFHRRVLGLPSRNLDLFLQGADGVLRTLSRQRAEIALLEGAMGFYDGLGGTDEASGWHVAETADVPALLALRPKGASLTLAAQVRGLLEFRRPSHIAGLLLTECAPALHAHLKPLLERETGLPVLGYLPPMEEARLESRHLGLLTADEVANFDRRFDAVAGTLEKTVDLGLLLELAKEAAPSKPAVLPSFGCRCAVAVARDDAFCFYYADNLDALRAAGAELRFFSPLADSALPEADGLYLGGGYPELHAGVLGENRAMLACVRRAVAGGLPTVAECGGFLYLQQSLRSPEGTACPMAGVLPGSGFPTDRLRRFGYLSLSAGGDSLLFRRGEAVPAHEFHYWDCTENGGDLTAVKPDGRQWRCGFASPTLYAAFPHLHFNGALPLAERFAAAAEQYRKENRR